MSGIQSSRMSDELQNAQTLGKSQERSVRKGFEGRTGKKDTPKLPLWIEIFFVQLGLPDSWLRVFLKQRKTFKQGFAKNKKPLQYTALVIIALSYCYPIVKQSIHHNHCVLHSRKLVKSKMSSSESISESVVVAIANRYCNGGDI